ncbi:LamG domain-containing protein [Candidatus Poribacteria bacterium]|nr:LamG domain-containing protein [Candidatus Poribacteria bacterium]
MVKRSSIILMLTIVASLVWYTNAMQAQQLVEKGLVSYWSFDKSSMAGKAIKDKKGGNDGIIVGNPEVVWGKISEALSLNDGREGDHIDVPDAPELHTTKELTICLWINFRGTKAPHNWPCIMRKGHSSGANYFFGLWDLTNEIYLTFTPPWQDRRSGLSVKQGDWSYAALRVNAPQRKVFFYVDGATSEVALGFDILPDTDSDIMIGGGVQADPADLNATIDELCLYNWVLSDDELKQNQKATHGLAVGNKRFFSLTWGEIKTLASR